MSALLNELKVRARLQLNARREAEPDLRLRDCLIQVARDVGFAHWEHARRVLGALAVPGDDMGTFWYAPRCSLLLNRWFGQLGEARAALAALAVQAAAGAPSTLALLPYGRQFVLAGEEFIRELGLDAHDAAWADAQHDLVRAYGSGTWQTLARKRLQAPRASFAPAR